MFILLKKKIYNIYFFLSLAILNLSLRFNSHKLCALIILLHTRKFITSNYSKKKILFFPKSGGNEDLLESFGSKNSSIYFLYFSRVFLKEIFHYHFKNTNKSIYQSDYYTKPQDTIEIQRKKKYIIFLTKTFSIINFFLDIDAIISFNLFYYDQKYFEEICKNLNIKFIVLHKESVFTPYDESYMPRIYRNYNDRSLAHKISVYSKSQKKILINSKISHKNQVTVNGCARSDYAFKLRKKIPKYKNIVFYLIEYKRGTHKHLNINVNFNSLLEKTIKYLKQFAIKNPDINVILKGKTGVHSKKKDYSGFFPKNCHFIDGGSGEKLLENASIVIAFNTTIVFETILSNRNLIIPNFNLEYKNKKQFLHKVNKKYLVNTKKEFFKKINLYLNIKYKNKKLSNHDKTILDYYLGNSDGKSAKRLKKFLINVINK